MGRSIALVLFIAYLCGAIYLLFFVRSKSTDSETRRSNDRTRVMIIGLLTCVLLVFGYFMFFFRTQKIELTKSELVALTQTWKDPESVQWHYAGTYEGFDYFHHRDRGTVMGYVVKEGEIEIEERFEATSDESKWTLLPWGPPENRKLEPISRGNEG